MALWQFETGAAIVPALHVHLRGTRLYPKPQMAGAYWWAKGGANQSVDEHEYWDRPKDKALKSIFKVEETLRHYLSPFLKTLPRSFTHSLSFICNSSFANSRAILQSLVRSSDKNSDGAMDFEELTTFGDFNLAYNIWPQHLQMAMKARWGMGKWVKFCPSSLFKPLF